MMAFRAGGCREAICMAVIPPQEKPIIPTFPEHQGWDAIQATTSTPSCCSCGRYSSIRMPPESPDPRMSTRTQA